MYGTSTTHVTRNYAIVKSRSILMIWWTRHRVCTSIEASTYGNPSTLCKKKFLYRMGPVFRASLWPDQWSHRVPLRIKWKVWTLSFNWYPLVFCGLSDLDTTATQSQAFFSKSWKCWKLTNFAQRRNSTFRTLFFKWLPFLEKSGYWHETKARWSSKHQIFMGRKKLVDLSNHFWDI